jgi:hypothetical protein
MQAVSDLGAEQERDRQMNSLSVSRRERTLRIRVDIPYF